MTARTDPPTPVSAGAPVGPALTPSAGEPAPPAQWPRIDIALLAVLLLLAAVLRITNFDAQLSLDELWHLGTTPGNGSPLGQVPADVLLPGLQSQTSLEHAAPFWKVWTGMDGILHPPLYCLTLRLWRDALGQSDFVAHLYSTVWSLIGIGFLYAIARESMNRTMAVIVTLGTTISQAQLYFAQEVRSYAMLIAIGTYALWVMTRIELRGPTRSRAIILGALTLPLLLTHYFAAGAALAMGVYGVLRLRGERLPFILTCVAAGAIYLVTWVPFALEQVNDLYTGDAFLHVEKFDYLRELLLVLCSPWRTVIDKDYRQDAATLAAGLLFILPWFLVRRNRALLPWAIWLTLSILPIAALDIARSTAHMSFPRYFAVVSPAVLLLAAGIVWSLDRRTGHLVGAALVVLIAITWRVEHRMSVDSPYQATARAYVRERIAPDEALLIYAANAELDFSDQIALTFSHDPAFNQRPAVKITRPLPNEMIAQLPGSAWIVAGGFFDLPKLIPGATIIGEAYKMKDEAILLHVRIRGASEPTTAPTLTTP